MFRVEPYQRLDNSKPVFKWIDAQDKKVRMSIQVKIEDLRNEGLNLLGTNALKIISGSDKGFYELRNVNLNWRIGLYFNEKYKVFIMLHGWHHDQSHKKEHQREIERARRLLHEYLKMENHFNG